MLFLKAGNPANPFCDGKFYYFYLISHANTNGVIRENAYSDLELFRRIADGDERAFTGLYLRYTAKLLAHITRLLDSEDWAEEIVQDIFVKLWEIRRDLGKINQPQAYLYRMASNRVLDHLKHRAVEAKMQYWLALNADNKSGAGIENEFDFKASSNLVNEAIGQLTDQKQIIYRLKHEKGYSYEQIAGKLNLSKNTVRNHLVDALQFIRRYLLRHGALHTVWFAFYLSLH